MEPRRSLLEASQFAQLPAPWMNAMCTGRPIKRTGHRCTTLANPSLRAIRALGRPHLTNSPCPPPQPLLPPLRLTPSTPRKTMTPYVEVISPSRPHRGSPSVSPSSCYPARRRSRPCVTASVRLDAVLDVASCLPRHGAVDATSSRLRLASSATNSDEPFHRPMPPPFSFLLLFLLGDRPLRRAPLVVIGEPRADEIRP